jgi:nucleoid-associated protein YgaU
LRNENLDLRKQLEERSGNPRGFTDRIASDKTANSPTPVNASRSYTVRPGDTLASISRKFYRTPARWKKILDANQKSIDNPRKLKVGQSLVIP